MSVNVCRAFKDLYSFTLFGYPLKVCGELRVSE